MNKSKVKGKSAERELCSLLEDYIGENWERCFTSGAFTGGKNATRIGKLSNAQLISQRGDIVPPDCYSNVVIECKFYKDFLFHQLFSNKPNTLLDDWIDQCKATIDDTNFWFIALKVNRKGWFFICHKQFIDNSWKLPDNFCIYQKDYFMMDFEYIFQNNRESIIKLMTPIIK